jgi:hypothetical protein
MKDIVTQTDIDIERLDPFSLPSVSFDERDELPEVSGIYFAISQAKTILYIGKASSIRKRWTSHHRFEELKPYKEVRIAWFTYITQDDEQLTELEKDCICHFKPSLNITGANLGEDKPTEKITLYLSWKQLVLPRTDKPPLFPSPSARESSRKLAGDL